MSLQSLVNHLELLGNDEIKLENSYFGICSVVRKNFSDHMGLVDNITDTWPKHSGNAAYPVPHEKMSAGDAFDFEDDLWANDQYGDDRRELCRFIADKIKSDYL